MGAGGGPLFSKIVFPFKALPQIMKLSYTQ